MIDWNSTNVTLETYLTNVDLNMFVYETMAIPNLEVHRHFQFGDNTDILFGDLTEVVYA